MARVISRRTLLKGSAFAVVVLGTGCTATGEGSSGATARPLTFTPIQPDMVDDVMVPEGYAYEVLVRWGDPIVAGAPAFDFAAQTRRAAQGGSSATTATTWAARPQRETATAARG